MKKLNAKFIVSAIIAAAMASATAVSVSADVDYPRAPVYAPVSGSTTSATDTSTSTGSSDEKTDESTTVASEDAVEAAIKAGKDVELKVADGKAAVSESAIGLIAAGDEAVTFDVDTDDIDYTVTIDPSDIKEVKAINLALDVEVAEDDDTGATCIIITPAQKGDFGMTIQITLPAAAFEDIDLDAAELYYVNDDGEVSLVADGLTVNSDGSVTIKISHASYYVISDVDLTESGAVDAGLDADDDDDTDVTIDEPSTSGKDDTSVVVNGNGSDSNPITGTTLALGSLAVFAAAAAITSKKRK